ncbi:MAG: hypothetical protein AB1758_10415 [Candidatus Eremiobacterota bacterium]
MPDKPRKELVLRSYEKQRGRLPVPGEFITAELYKGVHFVVFCSQPDCLHYHDREGALPFWSEDCPEHLGVMRCPECGAPAVRPPHTRDGSQE